MTVDDAPMIFFSIFLVVLLITFYCASCSFSKRATNGSAGASAPADNVTDGDGDGDGSGHGGHEQNPLGEITVLTYPRLRGLQAAAGGGEDGLSGICSICLSNYRETDIVRALPKCMHFFHSKCIDPWLKLHLNCPVCRKQLL